MVERLRTRRIEFGYTMQTQARKYDRTRWIANIPTVVGNGFVAERGIGTTDARATTPSFLYRHAQHLCNARTMRREGT